MAYSGLHTSICFCSSWSSVTANGFAHPSLPYPAALECRFTIASACSGAILHFTRQTSRRPPSGPVWEAVTNTSPAFNKHGAIGGRSIYAYKTASAFVIPLKDRF